MVLTVDARNEVANPSCRYGAAVSIAVHVSSGQFISAIRGSLNAQFCESCKVVFASAAASVSASYTIVQARSMRAFAIVRAGDEDE